MSEIEKLKEENENLKEEVRCETRHADNLTGQIKRLFDYSEELKKGNLEIQKGLQRIIEQQEVDFLLDRGQRFKDNSMEIFNLKKAHREENKKLKEEVKELTKDCEISTIIADGGRGDIYEHAEITGAERLCELGWADKDDFACLR